MSNPYYHALSSVRLFGGDLADYFPIHEWFDSSKSALPETRHRIILHHDYGVYLARSIFGRTFQKVAEQHLYEDYGKHSMSLSKIAHNMKNPRWGRPAVASEEMNQAMSEKFGGKPEDYNQLNSWVDGYTVFTGSDNGRLVTHSAFGCFLIPQVIGDVYQTSTRKLPTRYLVEYHIIKEFKFIPTVEKWANCLPLKKWTTLSGKPQKLSKEFE